MGRERYGYEFSGGVKKQTKKDQKNKCAVTGKKSYLEVHHMLGVALARGYFPTVDSRIFAQPENAIALNPEVHKMLHEEQWDWPPEFTRAFVIGMYKYLRDIYYDKLAEQELELAAV